PKAFAAMPASAMEISPEETVIMGDWAFSRGNYTAALTRQGNAVNVDGKFMTIFKRQDDGSWKIYRDIFNSNG
ncbi:MAG: nuclear transport factor 2 family protein, partial [Silicimonas sp.]|nr:nuclear transport factor 2 family protein [Silicimonas sp.]